jgi:hypothetical protein
MRAIPAPQCFACRFARRKRIQNILRRPDPGYPRAIPAERPRGAVAAAIRVIESGGRAPGHIQAVADALRPAYRVARPQAGELLDNMIRAQTRLTVQRLKQNPQRQNRKRVRPPGSAATVTIAERGLMRYTFHGGGP